MGNSFRKFFQSDVDEKKYSDNLPRIGSLFEDPRSPSDGIDRTPIVVEKKQYLETDVDTLTPPRHPHIRRLKKDTDPRSPSQEINRTPISVLDNYGSSSVFESPVSLYSRYEGDLESLTCFPSPGEPSVNVSDFEVHNVISDADVSSENLTVSCEQSSGNEISKINSSSTSSNARNEAMWKKQMCEDLINEIFDSFKESQKVIEAQNMPNKEQKLKLSKKQPLSSLKENPKSSRKSNRAPLSNITSAGNTPTQLTARKKDKNVRVEQTGENTPTKLISFNGLPANEKNAGKLKLRFDENVKSAQNTNSSLVNASNNRAQWSLDSTVII